MKVNHEKNKTTTVSMIIAVVFIICGLASLLFGMLNLLPIVSTMICGATAIIIGAIFLGVALIVKNFESVKISE